MEECCSLKNQTLVLGKKITIDTIQSVKSVFEDSLKVQSTTVFVDFSAVETVDYSFVQLFFSFYQTAALQKKSVEIVSLSEAIKDVFALSGIKSLQKLVETVHTSSVAR